MKKIMIFLVPFSVVVIALIVGISIHNNKPENIAIRTVTKSIEQLTAREEIAFIYNALKDGSISFSVKEYVNEEGNDELDGGTISGTLHFSEDAFMLKDFYLHLYDVKLDGNLYLSDEQFYLEEDAIVDNAYGSLWKDLGSDFEDSIFAYDSGSNYALSKDLSDSIANYDHESTRKMTEDAKELSEDLLKAVWDVFCESIPIQAETDQVRLNGEKVTARVIRIEITGESLAIFLENAITLLDDHEELNEFIDIYEDELLNLLSTYGIIKNDSLRDVYDEWIDKLWESLPDIQDNLKKNFNPITVKIATPKSSNDLLLLRVDKGTDTVLLLDCGKEGLSKSKKITFEIYGMCYIYEIEKNDDEDFCAYITVNGELLFSIDIDKDKGKFSVSAGNKQDNYTVKGKFEKDGKTTTLSVEDIITKHVYWQDVQTTRRYTTDTTIVIKQKDKMPSISEDFDKIYDISEKDLDAWLEKLNRLY